MTRIGKIARLPRPVREQLNHRLDNGEQSKALAAWLNGQPEVREKMNQDFHGTAISEQNLSEWKQGGFQDWLRHQEARECVKATAEEAQELAEDAGTMPLSETFSPTVALLIARLVREAGTATASGIQSTPAERRELLALIREWNAVRLADQKAARLKMDYANWTTAQARQTAKAALAKAQAPEWTRRIRAPE